MNFCDAVWGLSSLEIGLISDAVEGVGSFLKTEKDLVASLGSVVTAVTAVVGVIFGVVNLRTITANSYAQTRPYIQVSLALGVQLNGSVDLIIENRGGSTASNVRFSILDMSNNAMPNDYIGAGWSVVCQNTYTLSPNTRYRWMWSSIQVNGAESKKETDHVTNTSRSIGPGKESTAGFTGEVSLRVDYQSASGVFKKVRHYSDIHPLNARAYTALAPSPFEGAINPDSKRTVEDSLHEINKALRAHNIHVGMGNY